MQKKIAEAIIECCDAQKWIISTKRMKFRLLIVFTISLLFTSCNNARQKDISGLTALLGLLTDQSGLNSPQMGVPKFIEEYQISTDLIAAGGKAFFHNNPPSDLRYIGDVAINVLNTDVRFTGLSDTEVSLFILDPILGKVIFSQDNATLSNFSHPNLIGAKRLLALRTGQLVVIDKNGKLNLCFKVNQSIIYFTPTCVSESDGASTISLGKNRSGVFLFSDGTGIFSYDSIAKTSSSLTLGSSLMNILDIAESDSVLSVVSDGGRRLSTFKYNTTTSKYDPVANITGVTITYDESNSIIARLTSTIITKTGGVIASNLTTGVISFYTSNLIQTGFYRFNTQVKPFRGFDGVNGLRLIAENGFLYAFASNVVEVLSDNNVLNSGTLQWSYPSELDQISQAILSRLISGTFDITTNLLNYPEIQAIINSVQ